MAEKPNDPSTQGGVGFFCCFFLGGGGVEDLRVIHGSDLSCINSEISLLEQINML